MYLKNPLFNPHKSDNYYFFEFGSVPKHSREKFRLKLLKRKGAENYKNLILFDTIESLLENGMFIGENSNLNNFLAGKLNCSLRTLDCYKSRLLKQLREFHFNWYEIPGEDITEGIIRRIKSGMLREAKSNLMNLRHKTDASANPENKYLQFFTAEQLFYYYSYRNDLRKVNYYYNKAEHIRNSIISEKYHGKVIYDINIRYIFLRAHKLTLNRFKLKNIHRALEIIEELRLKYYQNLSRDQILKVHYLLSKYYNILKDNQRSKSEIKSAINLCKSDKLIAEQLIYESLLFTRKFTDDNKIAARALDFHKKNFSKIIKYSTDISHVLEFESNYLKFLIYTGDPYEEEITNDFINRLILYSRKSEALTSWYLELSDVLSSNIIVWRKINNYVEVRVDQEILKKFENMNQKSLSMLKNIYSPNVLSVLYINLIEQEFWKAKNADFLKAEIYIKKLRRIIKIHKPNISNTWIESTAFGLNVFEYSRYNSDSKVISKFGRRLQNLLENITSITRTFNVISDFAKMLFVKQQINIKEFNLTINQFEEYLLKYYPGLRENINRMVSRDADQDSSL
jgi:hypothetical protein